MLADYLLLVRFPRTGELTIFCGALVGASLGFLWYNSYPAGDLHGRRRLAGARRRAGTVAILIKQELLLVIVGGVFVMEAASVVMQVGSFKLTGKRVFKMAPLHHHFELQRLERAEDHRALPHPRDHLRVVQPDDAEAAVMAWTRRLLGHGTARGRRRRGPQRDRGGRTAGAARSARDADRDAADVRRRPTACASWESSSSWAVIGASTLEGADLIVASPGVALEQPVFDGARARAASR